MLYYRQTTDDRRHGVGTVGGKISSSVEYFFGIYNKMSKSAVIFEPLNPIVTLPLSDARVIYEPSVYLGDGTEAQSAAHSSQCWPRLALGLNPLVGVPGGGVKRYNSA